MEFSVVFGVVSAFEGKIVVVGVETTEGIVVVAVVGAAMVVVFRACGRIVVQSMYSS